MLTKAAHAGLNLAILALVVILVYYVLRIFFNILPFLFVIALFGVVLYGTVRVIAALVLFVERKTRT